MSSSGQGWSRIHRPFRAGGPPITESQDLHDPHAGKRIRGTGEVRWKVPRTAKKPNVGKEYFWDPLGKGACRALKKNYLPGEKTLTEKGGEGATGCCLSPLRAS